MARRRSGLRWICATVAPWALAVGLLVSFTAVASNDPQSGISGAALIAPGELANADALVPPSTALAAPGLPMASVRAPCSARAEPRQPPNVASSAVRRR